jgi:glycosyltransferase involved in cell wall biosynthesis
VLLRVLFVHEVSFHKKPVYEIHEFPEYLSVRGHDVTFFEFDEGKKFWKSDRRNQGESKNFKVLADSSVKVLGPFQLGVPGVDRVLAIFSGFLSLRRLIRTTKFDVIVLYAVPTYGMQVIHLAKTHRVPVLFRALDVTHKIRSTLFSPLIKRIERIMYTQADLVSANNPAMERYCRSLSSNEVNCTVHFPPLDLAHFQNTPRDQHLRNSLGISPETKVVMYMGSFFYFSGLVDALREFARQLQPGGKNMKFVLVGRGEQDSELRKLVIELGISGSVVFTGLIPYSDLPKYLASADVAINTLSPSLVSNAAFPNKVLQYLAAGLPVVSTKLDGLAEVFDDNNSQGLYWGNSPADVMRVAVHHLFSNSKVEELASLERVKRLTEKFSPKNTIDLMESTLADLAQRGK